MMRSLVSTPGFSTNIISDRVHCDPLSCVASGSRCHTADYLKETKDVDSPRKSAGQMPHYLTREYNKHKSSILLCSAERETFVKGIGGKEGKKLGGGVKKRKKESDSSLEDDSSTIVKPRKKSRGATGGQKSGGGKSIGVLRGVKGVKVTKPRTEAKGKLTLDYDSDDLLSCDDSTPKATIVESRSDSVGKHSVKKLLKKIKEKDKEIRSLELELSKSKVTSRMKIKEKDKEIRSLELELSKSKVTSRMNKTKVREELKWTGEEANFAETVNHFCRNFLFPKFKFLKDGWKEILPDKKNSLYSLCMRHLIIPEGANERDIWERVIVPSITKKYQHMKCNLNSDIKSIYMSTMTCLCHFAFAILVNYTDIYFTLCLNTTEERVVYPDELGNGFQTYIDLKIQNVVYDFMCTYVRRIKPDVKWKELLMKCPGCPFICCITPSDIAYLLAIIKNGKEMWDQAKNPGTSPEKKVRPLFSTGEGRKRESGISAWNKKGLEFYYTVEKNWREVYNSKVQFSVLINGWENWEPKDKSKKDALRTYWKKDEEEDKSGNEMDSGYYTDSDRSYRRGCGTWRDLKIKQQGGRTGRKLLDEMSDDGVGEDNGSDREREETCKKSKNKKKMMNARVKKSESEAKSLPTSPRKGRNESPSSPVRRSGRSRK
jgi:HEPN domain-containing protein